MRLKAWVERHLRRKPDDAVVTVAPNEAVAGMLCSTLRAEGIDCAHKHAGGAFPYGAVGGARLILVPARDAERARTLLDALSSAP
jgi:hypothetical protein